MIITKSDLPNLDLKGKVVGITSGCFDLLHFYHLRYLERCKALCDFLIVGVDSDLLVSQNKAKTPVIPEHHRMAMVDALKCVDATFRMDVISDIDEYARRSSAELMFKNLPNIYGNEVKAPEGVNLVLIPDIEEVSSTTGLINKIQNKMERKDTPKEGNVPQKVTSDETNETMVYSVEFFGKNYNIKKGSQMVFETPFDDAVREVVKIEEVYDEETHRDELLIYLHNGRSYTTKNRVLYVNTSGCWGAIYEKNENGNDARRRD